MLTIRLTRKGKKNQPFFRVVVIDKKRSSKGGRAVEDLGYKNPLTKKISINKERALYWMKNGAQPSATVHNLFISEKILDAKKIAVAKISKKKQAELDKAKADAEAAAKAKAEKEVAEKEAAKKAAEDAKAAEEAAKKAEAEKPAEPAPAEAPVETPKEEPKPEEKPAV